MMMIGVLKEQLEKQAAWFCCFYLEAEIVKNVLSKRIVNHLKLKSAI